MSKSPNKPQEAKLEEAKTEEQAAAEAEAAGPKLNKDGLIPGQEVDLATARRLEKQHAKVRPKADSSSPTK